MKINPADIIFYERHFRMLTN